MLKLVKNFAFLVGMVSLMLSLHVSPGFSEGTPVYGTPPSALSGLSQSELNSFGLKLLTEAYDIRSRVERPTAPELGAGVDLNTDAVKRVQSLYDDAAMVQRARLNYAMTKGTYVPNYTGRFTISNVAVSQTSDTVMVLSFDVELPDRVSLQSGIEYSGHAAPRLLVMRWNEAEKMWKIFSHADFDAPRNYVCGANVNFMPPRSDFKPEDIGLAKSLWDEVQTSSLTDQPQTMHSKGFQFVFASGERKTAPGKTRARLTKREDIMNVEAIRSGDLFVLRFDSVSPMTLDGGQTDKVLRPRLATFHRDADGKWRMNAVAVFQVTAKLAEDIECDKP